MRLDHPECGEKYAKWNPLDFAIYDQLTTIKGTMMSIEGNGSFDPKAWTPARTALWNALTGSERKELEDWVAKGNDAPVPPKWGELHVQLRGVKKQSSVPQWIVSRMREIGRTDPIIETVYGKYYQD